MSVGLSLDASKPNVSFSFHNFFLVKWEWVDLCILSLVAKRLHVSVWNSLWQWSVRRCVFVLFSLLLLIFTMTWESKIYDYQNQKLEKCVRSRLPPHILNILAPEKFGFRKELTYWKCCLQTKKYFFLNLSNGKDMSE